MRKRVETRKKGEQRVRYPWHLVKCCLIEVDGGMLARCMCAGRTPGL